MRVDCPASRARLWPAAIFHRGGAARVSMILTSMPNGQQPFRRSLGHPDGCRPACSGLCLDNNAVVPFICEYLKGSPV